MNMEIVEMNRYTLMSIFIFLPMQVCSTTNNFTVSETSFSLISKSAMNFSSLHEAAMAFTKNVETFSIPGISSIFSAAPQSVALTSSLTKQTGANMSSFASGNSSLLVDNFVASSIHAATRGNFSSAYFVHAIYATSTQVKESTKERHVRSTPLNDTTPGTISKGTSVAHSNSQSVLSTLYHHNRHHTSTIFEKRVVNSPARSTFGTLSAVSMTSSAIDTNIQKSTVATSSTMSRIILHKSWGHTSNLAGNTTFASGTSTFVTATPALDSRRHSSGAMINPSPTSEAPIDTIGSTFVASYKPVLSSNPAATPAATKSPLITDEILIFRLTSLVVNRTFTAALVNHTKNTYIHLAALLRHELHTILNETANFRDAIIVNFLNSSDSVQMVADIYYNFTTSATPHDIIAIVQAGSSSFTSISINEICTIASCRNGGTCQETSTNVTCSCKTGFNGPRCFATFPVDGGYTEWSNYRSCSKSCGGGLQVRTRSCTNPSPLHGGRNCTRMGIAREERNCNEKACNEIDSVIWIIVAASAFVLLMVIILACCFQKRKKYYYKDFGLSQNGRSYSLTKAAYVNKAYSENPNEFRSHENVVSLEILKEDPFKNSHTNRQLESVDVSTHVNSVYERELQTFLTNTQNIRSKEAADSGQYLEPEITFHSPKKPSQDTAREIVYQNTPERML